MLNDKKIVPSSGLVRMLILTPGTDVPGYKVPSTGLPLSSNCFPEVQIALTSVSV